MFLMIVFIDPQVLINKKFQHKIVNIFLPINFSILSVESQNFVTLIFTKTTFCQRGNTKRMASVVPRSRFLGNTGFPLPEFQGDIYKFWGTHQIFQIYLLN